MGSVTNSLNGLSYLMQAGEPLSKLPSAITQKVLESASTQDVVSLSMSAIQSQNMAELFGTSTTSTTTLPVLGLATQSSTDVLPGVSAADLTNATTQQKDTLNNQALQLQEAESLFGMSTTDTSTTSVLG